jgi:hypothetical protein
MHFLAAGGFGQVSEKRRGREVDGNRRGQEEKGMKRRRGTWRGRGRRKAQQQKPLHGRGH